MQRVTGTVLATAGLLLAVTGCSGDDEDGKQVPTTPQGVLEAYFAAIDAGDDDAACDFESATFTEKANEAAQQESGDDDVTCSDRIDARHAEVKDADQGLADSQLEVTGESGSQAMVEVTYPGEESVAAYYLLVPEGETWLVSDVRTPRG